MNRRNFLKVVFAAGIATAVPVALASDLPLIMGDGVHDDTEGLQAAVDGKPFYCVDGTVRIVDGHCVIVGGKYRTSRTLRIGYNASAKVTNNLFVGGPTNDADPWIAITGGTLDRNTFVGGSYRGLLIQ